jgi:hypothetical protein
LDANLISFIPSEDDGRLAKETRNIRAPRGSAISLFDLRVIDSLKEPSIKIPVQAAHLALTPLWQMLPKNDSVILTSNALSCVGGNY